MVGILTWHKQYNYGAALQAYALLHTVKQLGYNCKIINYYYENDMRNYDIRWKSKSPFAIAFDILTLISCNKRKKNYHKFGEKYFDCTELVYDIHGIENVSLDMDTIICGSEQIWNVCRDGRVNPVYFLTFAKDKRKIAYAPSFGGSNIPTKYHDDLKNCLESFEAISVRERNNAVQLENIIKRKVSCVVDPTFLLDSKDYDDMIEGYHIKLPRNYVFLYSINTIDLKNLMKSAEKIAKKNNLKIVYFSKIKILNSLYAKNIFAYDPRAFIETIKNASYVVTNSFHACVFSVIYKKNFAVHTKYADTNRLQMLFEELNIGDRVIGNDGALPSDIIDYDKVYKKLAIEKKASLDYLSNALKGEI